MSCYLYDPKAQNCLKAEQSKTNEVENLSVCQNLVSYNSKESCILTIIMDSAYPNQNMVAYEVYGWQDTSAQDTVSVKSKPQMRIMYIWFIDG